MIDLRHREPERRQPGLLLQHRGEVALHAGELALGDADLVAAPAGGDDARRVFRIGAERHHVRGDAVERAHEQVMQGEVDERRRDRRDQQRDQEHVARIPPHRLAQRAFVDHDLDELAAHRRRPDRPDDVVVAVEQKGAERLDDGRPRAHVAGIDLLLHLAGEIGRGEQAALLAHLHRHRPGADAVEDLLGEALRHHAARRRIEHQRGGVGGGEAVIEPGQAEIRDRRHIDQHFRQHDENDRQDQKLARQAEPDGRLRRRRIGRTGRDRSGFATACLNLRRARG